MKRRGDPSVSEVCCTAGQGLRVGLGNTGGLEGEDEGEEEGEYEWRWEREVAPRISGIWMRRSGIEKGCKGRLESDLYNLPFLGHLPESCGDHPSKCSFFFRRGKEGGRLFVEKTAGSVFFLQGLGLGLCLG